MLARGCCSVFADGRWRRCEYRLTDKVLIIQMRQTLSPLFLEIGDIKDVLFDNLLTGTPFLALTESVVLLWQSKTEGTTPQYAKEARQLYKVQEGEKLAKRENFS
jgi:hypothetical protein